MRFKRKRGGVAGKPAWTATVDNGRDLEIRIWKNFISAHTVSRSSGMLLDTKILPTHAPIRVASAFDPNKNTKVWKALETDLLDWLEVPRTNSKAPAPTPAPAPTGTGSHGGGGVKSQTMFDNKSDLMEFIRQGKPEINYTVTRQEGNKILEIRIDSISVCLPQGTS